MYLCASLMSTLPSLSTSKDNLSDSSAIFLNYSNDSFLSSSGISSKRLLPPIMYFLENVESSSNVSSSLSEKYLSLGFSSFNSANERLLLKGVKVRPAAYRLIRSAWTFYKYGNNFSFKFPGNFTGEPSK